jgi:acyl-CoA thioesterase
MGGMSFSELQAAVEPRDDGFTLGIPPEWHQGRTAYGGFSAALALEAARQASGVSTPLRSAQVAFVGPLYGAVEARAQVLRSGKNATWVAVELIRANEHGEGEVGLAATFVFMGPVASALHLNDCAPPADLIPVDRAKPLQFADRTPLFLRNHFEVRFARPRVTERIPEFCWWVRPKDHADLDPMVAALLCADAVPPGVIPLMQGRAPVSTMTWQANLLTPAPATREGWWLLRSTGSYAENGCSSQHMELWNAAGEPILAAIQSVALFG